MGVAQVYNVKDYGARGDWNGSTGTDDTAAIRATIAAAPPRAATIFFPKGLYRITDSIDVINNVASGTKMGMRLIGDTGGAAGAAMSAGSTLIWDGASTTTPMVKMYSRENTMANLGFSVASGKTAKCAIDVDQEPNLVSVTTDNEFWNIGIYAQTFGGAMTNGIDIAAITVGNTDFNRFYRCQINGVTNACWRILFSQAKSNLFIGCVTNNAPIGIYQLQGSFQMYGCAMNSHSQAAIVTSQPTDHIYISSMNSENCARFLDTSAGGSTSNWPFTIIGGRFALNGLHADGEYIKFTYGGPLIIQSCLFSGDPDLRISAHQGGPGSKLISIGNAFPTLTPYKSTDTMHLVSMGNHCLDGSTQTTMPDVIASLNGATGGAHIVQTPLGMGNPTLTTMPLGTGPSGAGVTVNAVGDVRRVLHKATFTFAAFSAAALQADKTIYTLAAKQKIVSIYAEVTEGFSGPGITGATMIVGDTVGGNELLVSFSVAAPIVRGLVDTDLGTPANRTNAVQGGVLPSWTGTTNLTARLITTGANTNVLSAGSITFHIALEMF